MYQLPLSQLATLLIILILLHLGVMTRIGDLANLGISALLWLGILGLLSEKQASLNLMGDRRSQVLGAFLVGGFLVQSSLILWVGPNDQEEPYFVFVRTAPLLVAVGLSLMAASYRYIKQFWQELIVAFLMGTPSVLLRPIDLSPVTAVATTVLLQGLGYPVSLEGLDVLLPTGGVTVYPGCAGMESALYLLAISTLCLLLFPLRGRYQILVPVMGVVIGFVVNVGRVAFLTILSAADEVEAFDYWHTGDGSKLVGGIAILVFGLFYTLLFERSQAQTSSPDLKRSE